MQPDQAKKEIDRLTKLINHHNDLYYQQNSTEITDEAFDALLRSLTDLEQQYPQYREPDSPTQRVGGTVTKAFATVYHKYPMLSLGNTYSREELE